MFTIVIEVRGAVPHNPMYDWRVIVSVDGRQINKAARSKTNPKDVKVSTMIFEEDGALVEGKLIFAKLVGREGEG